MTNELLWGYRGEKDHSAREIQRYTVKHMSFWVQRPLLREDAGKPITKTKQNRTVYIHTI